MFQELPLYQHGFIVPQYGDETDPIPVLPATLQVLTVYWPTEDMILWLEDLFETIDPHNLKEINLMCRALPGGKPASWFLLGNFGIFEDFSRRNVAVRIHDEKVIVRVVELEE